MGGWGGIMSPIDELKELEAQLIGIDPNDGMEYTAIVMSNGGDYRRLALEVAIENESLRTTNKEIDGANKALERALEPVEAAMNKIQVQRPSAVDVAKELQALIDRDEAIARDEVIFSPSDPRVVVGQTYEFSDWWDFSDGPGVSELIAVHETSEPFIHGESGWPYTFIRELPKEERGQNE
jgi:hypothetical protein